MGMSVGPDHWPRDSFEFRRLYCCLCEEKKKEGGRKLGLLSAYRREKGCIQIRRAVVDIKKSVCVNILFEENSLRMIIIAYLKLRIFI